MVNEKILCTFLIRIQRICLLADIVIEIVRVPRLVLILSVLRSKEVNVVRSGIPDTRLEVSCAV